MQQSERDSQIDHLYELPLGEFTAARDELAGRLRREGEGDAAAEVKQLRKPSVAAWALNQVRRNNPQQVDELIEAGSRLRDGHERLLAGEGRQLLDEASDEERRLVAALAGHAERELVSAGRPVSASVQEKLRGTLHAVATDPEARERLGSGRLVHEYAPSALGPLLGAEASSGSPRPRERGKRLRKKDDAELARKARRQEEQLDRARAKQQKAEEELSEARRHLRDARREATRVASKLERAEAAEEDAAARAEEAGERAAELEAALRESAQESRPRRL